MRTRTAQYDGEAQRLELLLPAGPRIVAIGSTDFWHPDSERTCMEAGRSLAEIANLVLITGGVEGIGETIGRSFFQARGELGQAPRVYHVLPKNEPAWDYGETLFAGDDMTERREILGRLSSLFLTLEGGPGVKHETEVASSMNAIVIPVGRSGGYSTELYAHMERPLAIDEQTWKALGSTQRTPEETAWAILQAVRSCLEVTV